MNKYQAISRDLANSYRAGQITYNELNAELAVMFAGMSFDEVINFKLE